MVTFGTRAVWNLYWPYGKILSRYQVCIFHCTFAVMSQPNEPAGTTLNPLAALTTTLKLLMPNQPVTNYKTATSEWTTSSQYDEFKLFWESTESWFCLQAIPEETDDKGAYLEYILNVLSTTGHWRWTQWTPTGMTANDAAATERSAKSFLDHLAYQMDHTLSQRCQIYQLEEVWIKPGQTPDEMVDHLRALADKCNFLTDKEKEWNVQFYLFHAITDSELAKKLLTIHLKTKTAKMLETCRTHKAITENLHAMGLGSKTVNAVNKWSQWPQSSTQQHQIKTSNPRTNIHMGIALNPIHLAEPPALPRTPHANVVAKLVTGMSDAEAPSVDRWIQTRSHADMDTMVENKSRPTLLM